MRRWLIVCLIAVLAVLTLVAMTGTSSAATTNVATTGSFTFSPATVRIAPGDTISWTGLTGHTVTADDGSFTFSGGDSFSRMFTTAATIRYYCAIHGGPNGVGMSGMILVGAEGTSTPTSTPSATPTASPTATPASSGTTVLAAAMFGVNQVPPVTTSGYGSVRLTLDPTNGTIAGRWALNNLSSTITNAHIHTGAAGASGSPIVDFTSQVVGASGTFTTANTGVATSTIDSILANPAGVYVNVHTANNSGGEIRGQLVSAPPIVSNVVSTTLSGANQVPPVTTSATGQVALTFDPDNRTATGRWTVTGLGSLGTNAHIHAGPAGANGAPIVDFSSMLPPAGGQFTTSNTGLSASLINAVLYAPWGYYVNVHTRTNAAGEVRGQLLPERHYLASVPRSALVDAVRVAAAVSR